MQTAYSSNQAEAYDQHRFSDMRGKRYDNLEWEEVALALAHAPPLPRSLEIGAGTGRFVERLARRSVPITALDPSEPMLDKAREKCKNLSSATFVKASGTSLPFEDQSFQFVYAVRVLNQLGNKAAAFSLIREAARVTTNDGGILLLEYVNASRPFRKKSPAVRLTKTEILREASSQGLFDQMFCHGVMLVSETIFRNVPGFAFPLIEAIEHRFGQGLPEISSRVFLCLRRTA